MKTALASRKKIERTTGRKDSGRFALIPKNVMLSEEFLSLTGRAVHLLLAIAAQYSGYNNGNLCAAQKVLRPYGFTSADTIARSLKQLLDVGLLIKTREGLFFGGVSKCALYALAWQPINDIPGKGLTVKPTKAPPRCFIPVKNQTRLSESRSNPAPRLGALMANNEETPLLNTEAKPSNLPH